VSVQLPAQVPLPSLAHRPLGQGAADTVVQEPAPLHTEAGVPLPPVHEAAVQTVLLLGMLQTVALVPSHWPLHLPEPPHATRLPRGSPDTVVHFPTLPDSLQA
jgi:hypothetical protein